MSFRDIPSDMYYIFASFLSPRVYLKLLSCNKTIFSQIKYETAYRRVILSQMPLTNAFERLFLSVKDASEQISLYIVPDDNWKFDFSNKNIHQLSLNGKRWNNWDFSDFLSFNSIVSLTLDAIMKLKDLSVLLNSCQNSLEELKLTNLPCLENVNHLKSFMKLRKLHISSCKLLSDLPMLENVSNLFVSGCERLSKDLFSTRRSLHTFHYYFLTVTVPSLSILDNSSHLYSLYVHCFQFGKNVLSSVSDLLKNIPILDLHCYCGLDAECEFPLSVFCGKQLTLDGFLFCRLLSFTSALTYLSLLSCSQFVCLNPDENDKSETNSVLLPSSLVTLVLRYCDNDNDISGFHWIKHLFITDCPRIKTVSTQLSSQQWISIRFKTDISSFRSFSNVYSFSLANYAAPIDTQLLRKIKILRFEGCHGLKDLSYFNKAQSLYISDCHQVTSLKGAETISYLYIYECWGITSIDELENGTNEYVVFSFQKPQFKLTSIQSIKFHEIVKRIPFCRIGDAVFTLS
jgi:hypothetical protein